MEDEHVDLLQLSTLRSVGEEILDDNSGDKETLFLFKQLRICLDPHVDRESRFPPPPAPELKDLK